MLIESLIAYRKRKGHDITVVFDGWKTGQGHEHHGVTGGVRVIYSGIGENADAVIKRLVSSVKRQWIVITSDKDIADHAWSRDSVPVASEDFLQVLGRREPQSDEKNGHAEEYHSPSGKGNPRRLSKKAKAVGRALNKL